MCLCPSAYETLSDDDKRREYDQFGHRASSGEGQGGGGGGGTYDFNQHFKSFNFNFDEIFKEHETLRQQHHRHHHFHSNSNPHHKAHFDSHFQAHREAMNRHRTQFQQGGFGTGLFDDVFEDLEKMFSFNTHSSGTEERFQGSTKQQCRTVTQRKGNMVTTFTDCS